MHKIFYKKQYIILTNRALNCLCPIVKIKLKLRYEWLEKVGWAILFGIEHTVYS